MQMKADIAIFILAGFLQIHFQLLFLSVGLAPVSYSTHANNFP